MFTAKSLPVVVGTTMLNRIHGINKRSNINVAGGCGLFAALGCSVFLTPAFVSVIGRNYPKKELTALGQRVDMQNVIFSRHLSNEWDGTYYDDLDRLKEDIVTIRDPNLKLKVPSNLKKSTFIYIAGMDASLQNAIIDEFAHPKIVMIDTNFFDITKKPEIFADSLRKVNIASLNHFEALAWSGASDIYGAIAAIQACNTDVVIIRRGSAGAVLAAKDLFLSIPALNKSPFETTGAGDSFGGAFLSSLACIQGEDFFTKQNLEEAFVRASAVASFAVEKKGAKALYDLTKDEVFRRIEETKAFSRLKYDPPNQL